MERRVAIIGGGISGLLACKHIVDKGLRPTVFEAEDHIGGVWDQTLASTRLQTSKKDYQFSDFPWPSSVQENHPHNTQVLEYIQSYAQQFQLFPYVKFNSKVISMDYVGVSAEEMQSWDLWGGNGKAFGCKGKWNLKVLHTKEESIKVYVAEFVVVCVGKFSGLPNIPEFSPGHSPEIFSGKVLHSMDYSTMDKARAAQFIKGKRIAVIGSGKSAVDIAYECSEANGTENPCTLIQRNVRWMLPDLSPFGVNFGYICLNRFYELMVHKPGEGFLSSVMATLLSPLRRAIAMSFGSYVKWKLPLKKYGMIPKQDIFQQLSSCLLFKLPENFYDKVAEGSIVLKKSQNLSFCEKGLILDGEPDPLKVDIVIFATGYQGDRKLKNMFACPTFQNFIIGSPNSTGPLYRQTIHPRIPQLAVVGYSVSVSNLSAFELRSQWLSHFLNERFELPTIKEMDEQIIKWEEYMKHCAGNNHTKACVNGFTIWINDQLCRDIGINPRRKKGFFSELFEPYGGADYKGLTPPV